MNNLREWNTKYFSIATNTNGTNLVNVFNPNVPQNCTITAVFGGALDNTAGDNHSQRAKRQGVVDATVATFAKGTTSGAMTMAVNLANAVLARGDILTVKSSSGGNATVFINYSL